MFVAGTVVILSITPIGPSSINFAGPLPDCLDMLATVRAEPKLSSPGPRLPAPVSPLAFAKGTPVALSVAIALGLKASVIVCGRALATPLAAAAAFCGPPTLNHKSPLT